MAKLMGGDRAAGGSRRTDAGAHGEDRHRARQAVRHEQARSGRTGRAEGHPADRLKQIEASKASLGAIVDGWVVTKGLGTYGTDYLKRAVVAAFGWPANQEKDAVYPYTEVDSAGQTLTGANKYTLTFAKDATPPVNGFWSITMYMIDQGWWFVPNALNKFTVSPRNNLKPNADGSLTLYFQTESPGAGQGGQLAAGTEGPLHPHAADVLAEGHRPVDPEWHLEGATGGQSRLMPGPPFHSWSTLSGSMRLRPRHPHQQLNWFRFFGAKVNFWQFLRLGSGRERRPL